LNVASYFEYIFLKLMNEGYELKTLSRKERELLTRRNEILTAAERVFAKNGYFGTTMAEIAAEAEFGTGTLYSFFASKEDLYFAVIDEKMSRIQEILLAILKGKGTCLEKIENVLKSDLRFIEENRDTFTIYFHERDRLESRLREKFEEVIKKKYITFLQAVAGTVEEGIRDNEIRKIDPMDVAIFFAGIIRTFFVFWAMGEKKYPLTDKFSTMKELFLRGVGA